MAFRRIIKMDSDYNEIQRYESISDALRKNDLPRKGRIHQAIRHDHLWHGFRWRYEWDGKGDRYDVKEDGRIWSNVSGRWMTINSYGGYQSVELAFEEGCGCAYSVHRLVAEKYVPNPNNLPEINHLDGVKDHNHKDNLEWCTHAQNINHADRTGLRTKTHDKVVYQYAMDGVFIKRFDSVAKANTSLGKRRHASSIANNLKGLSKSAYGFIWRREGLSD